MDLVIDRNIWLRGEGPVESRLHRESDGKMCCVGIYLAACGVPLEKLTGRKTKHELKDDGAIANPPECDWLNYNDKDDYFYRSNDSDMLEGNRERSIVQQFAVQGVNVTFIN